MIKDKIVIDYLYKNYSSFIINWKENIFETIVAKQNNNMDMKKLPIWVCWLQGEESAPLVVKQCIKSIQNKSLNHPVIVLSQDNIEKYIDFPGFVMKMLNDGIITRTNFSDILRAALLAEYGGLWIDSTFFLSQNLPEEYFSYPVFSAGKQPEPRHRRWVCISRYRWVGSFLGANISNNILFCFIRDFFYEYLNKDGGFIDYLLVDYLIWIAYNEFPTVKKQIDSIPDNNFDLDKLFHSMNKKFDEEKARKMLFNKTLAFKLSYKMNWKEKNLFKHRTFYSYFINGYGDIF
jgi:hypothetical protein